MRGLDIRVMYAKAKVKAITSPGGAEDDFLEVLQGAHDEGHMDYHQHRENTVPTMFADVRMLACAWKNGYILAGELDEMLECPHCRESRGNPCPCHG